MTCRPQEAIGKMNLGKPKVITAVFDSTSSSSDKLTNLNNSINSWDQTLPKDHTLVFHYTSLASAKNIIADGAFRMSDTGMEGPGVYFTKISPTKAVEEEGEGAVWPWDAWKVAMLKDSFGDNHLNRKDASESVIISHAPTEVLKQVHNRPSGLVVLELYVTHIKLIHAVQLYAEH